MFSAPNRSKGVLGGVITLHKEKEGHLRDVAQGRISEGVVTSEELSAHTLERKYAG